MDNFDELAYKNQIKSQKYNKLTWSNEESLFRKRSKYRKPNLIHNKVPVTLALHIRLKQSCFGRFMKTFNQCQKQNIFLNDNKLGIEEWNLNYFTQTERIDWENRHSFSDDLFLLLKSAVASEDCIDYDYLYKNLTGLRLNDIQINQVDSLKQFKNLKVLILSGNWISKVPEKFLPKTLQFLELFVNEILDVTALCNGTPTRILHLGLGRNLLTNNSQLHLLGGSRNFSELHTLDISNNDIDCLLGVLRDLKELPYLVSLALEGNPCYTCETYKECVLSTFPKLIFLDGTEILPEDRKLAENFDTSSNSNKGALTFTCYRLIGILIPPKGKVVHTYHLEVELPLLEEIKLPVKGVPPQNEQPSEEPTVAGKKGKGIKDDNKKKVKKEKSDKSSKKSKAQKAIKGKGLYALSDEHATELENKIENKNFKTEPQQWGQIIKFKDPAIVINPPDNDLRLLRDTLRTRIKIKIIYIQKIVNKVTKKKQQKGKKSETGPVIPDELILKKSTFATFFCDLHTVNWSDSYVDFIWANSPKIGDLAIPIEGNLKPEIYAESGKKRKGKTEKKSSNKTKENVSEKLPLPTILTCHFGFGLKRFGINEESTPVSKKHKKK